MRSLDYQKNPSPLRRAARYEAVDISLGDRLRVMAETIAQLNERIEFLEAREVLHRSRQSAPILLPPG